MARLWSEKARLVVLFFQVEFAIIVGLEQVIGKSLLRGRKIKMLKLGVNGSQRVFLTADYHFNHGNIIKYCNRPFKNSQEMDECLIKNTNDLVKPNDVLIFGGDWCFPGREDYLTVFKKYRDRIACNNIYFVYGNHDRRPAYNAIIQAFMRLQFMDLNRSAEKIVEDLRNLQNFANSIQNIEMLNWFRGCGDLFEFEHQGTQAIFGHYAYRIWNKSHHGCIHCYGHSHFSLSDDPDSLSMDVGVDAAANYISKDGKLYPENYRPLAWSDIMNHMDKKNFKPVDHHGRGRR